MAESRYYDSKKKRLIYVSEAADPEHWDKHWSNTSGDKLQFTSNRFVTKWTTKYLEKGSTVLEGGCGLAQSVWSLQQAGYNAIGVDFAAETVSRVKKAAPELDVRFGDVRNLPFQDAFFDAYWSLGVIEHFWEGYSRIAEEMYRVLKPSGHLFLTVPTLCCVRKWLAEHGRFRPYEASAAIRRDFYQYALAPESIIAEFSRKNFILLHRGYYDGLKGLKDDVLAKSMILQRLYDGSSLYHRAIRRIISPVLDRITPHMVFFVFQKQGEKQ